MRTNAALPGLAMIAAAALGCSSRHRLLVCPTGAVISAPSRHSDECLDLEKAGSMGLAVANDGKVLKVTPGGPADVARLRPGDRVIAVNDVKVSSAAQIRRLLFGPAGSSVTVEAMREGRLLYFCLISRPYAEVPDGRS
jgi:S1-C subfamily serine protease